MNAKLERAIHIASAASASAFLLISCGAADDPYTQVPPGPVRLADLLEQAEISSPLIGLSPERSAWEDAEREIVFEQDFESFDLKEAGWPESMLLEVDRSAGRSSLLLRGLNEEAGAFGWVVPAQPLTHYDFERAFRSNAPLDMDFVVFERGVPAKGDEQLIKTVQILGGDLSLKVHWPEQPTPDGSWQAGQVSFLTTATTRSLAIVLRGSAERIRHLLRGSSDSTRGEDETRFDDLRLEMVRPTALQTMALMKARSPLDGSDRELGIAKYGQFPPIDTSSWAQGFNEENFSYFTALYAPPPTDLTFPLRLGADASLSFSVCVAEQTLLGDGARFDVLVREDGEEQVLWSQPVTALEKNWGWHGAEVDLAAYSGRSIELVLRTTATSGHPHPMWGNPIIDAPAKDDPPHNVILIAVDTLRADHLSSYGYSRKTSPHLDALAADGVRFEHTVSNANWTCPSFASIFTGLVPTRHGVWFHNSATPLAVDFETLAERFRSHGWATRGIAYKVPLYDGGFEQGFDVWFNAPREFTDARHNLMQALEWLKSAPRSRNFLFLHFNDPHAPFTQQRPFDSLFGPSPEEHGLSMPLRPFALLASVDDGSSELEPDEAQTLLRNLYDGEVAFVDNRIGAFLQALKKRGLYENAVIVFVSDHGEQLWDHGEYGHLAQMLHDEVVRVPLIIKQAGPNRARGKVVRTQVRAFDVMPTLLELAGIPYGDELQAQSLVDLLAPDASDAPDRLAVTESSSGSLAVRNRAWKYILWSRQSGPIEALFDLQADPGEEHDLVATRPEMTAQMRIQALDYALSHRAGPFLVAIGEEAASDFQLTLQGVHDATTLFGPAPARDDGDGIFFAGSASEQLQLVASITAGTNVRIDEREYSTDDLARYQPGDLARLLSAPRSGVTLYAGLPPLAVEGPSQTEDARTLKALKALGYLGDDSGGN